MKNSPPLASVMSEVTWNRRRGPPPREGPSAKFFITANYVEAGENTLETDFVKIRENMGEVACGPDGKLEAAMFWEERGHNTGNPHFHGILIFKRGYRTRCTWVANLLVDTLGLQVRPHIEPLKDLRGAVQYRDKPSKGEAWNKWVPNGRSPNFFAVIH